MLEARTLHDPIASSAFHLTCVDFSNRPRETVSLLSPIVESSRQSADQAVPKSAVLQSFVAPKVFTYVHTIRYNA